MREKTKAHKSLPFGVVLWDRLRKATKSKSVSSIKRPSNSPAALKWQRELASWYSPKIEENNYDDDLDFDFTSDGLISFSSGSFMDGNSNSNNSHTLAALSEQVSHMFMSPPLANVSSLSYYNSSGNGSNINSPLLGNASPMGSPATRRRTNPYAFDDDASAPSSPLVLPTHDEVARSLTDLQKHMLKIVRENKGRASLDTIVEGIQKSRDTLRKRDGSQYAIDCRRAVAATLAKTSFNSSLFVRDDSDVWKFGPLARVLNLDLIVIGDIAEPPSKRRRGSGSSENSDESESSNISSPSIGSRYLRRVPGKKGERALRLYAPGKREIDEMNNEGDFSDNEDDHDIDQDDEDEEALDEPGGESEDSPRGTPRFNRKRGRPSKHKDDSTEEPIQGSPIQSREGLPESDGSELTQLQLMMIEAINKSGGSAPLGIVYKYVSKRWGNLRRRDDSLQNVDCKTAVKSSLSADAAAIAPIFDSDSHREGCWKVTRLGMELMRSAKEKKERKQQQQQAQKASAQTEEQPKLTDMQGMLMKIIIGFGGAASFDQIFTEVTTKWKTKWDTDCKRALLASLSHNPPGNFKKNKDGLWTIAPKALPLVSSLE